MGRGAKNSIEALDFSSLMSKYLDMSIEQRAQLDQMADRLAALGNPSRLRVLRALVRAGDGGLTVGQILEDTGMAASTQFHHLSALVDAGIVRREKVGKEVVNRVDFSALRGVADYLLKDCCKGR
jgi:ArsR family transcriptional regulator